MTNTIFHIEPTSKYEDLPDPYSLEINFDWQIAISFDMEKSENDKYGRSFFWICQNGEWSESSMEFAGPKIFYENTVLPIDPKFLHDALDKWGDEAQIMLVIEECAELIQALTQTFRNSKDPDVITEIADVLITVSQMRELFGKEEVDKEIKRKIERTKRKLYG